MRGGDAVQGVDVMCNLINTHTVISMIDPLLGGSIRGA